MFQNLLHYPFAPGDEAFTTRRDSVLPYPVIQGHQVHGTEVAIISRPGITREELEGYDAFITDLPGVAIGVRTADCVPILLYDPRNRVIAAIHSGWKGTVQKVAAKTIGILETRFKTAPEDLLAVIGPSIGPESFQVGEEVVTYFKDAGFPLSRIWSFHGTGDGSPMSGGHHIDLWQANRWILQECGLRDENIRNPEIDTYTDPSFYSARREGIACGRNINAIKIWE
jgi:YfiH family protein